MTRIGIDLGTTNSLAAYWDGDKAILVKNAHSHYLTPSVVSIANSGEVFVGEIAKQRLISHPLDSASNFKRKMGSKAKFKLGKRQYSPEELSSLVLKQLKLDAEKQLGHSVDSAVISVPAYFNDAQRKATKIAGELAGLNVERLINEPTAAAIAYGIHEQYQESNIIVIDLGGGTFDVSVLELFEGVMEVHSSAGDNYLGGEDFTEQLYRQLIQDNNLKDTDLAIKQKAITFRKLENLKVELSQQETASCQVTLNEQIIDWSCNREDMASICDLLIKKLRHPIERAIRDARLNLSELDEIILVGGATRMPMIRNLVSRMFRRLPSSHIDPDQVVALGSAVQCALLAKDKALDDVVLTDVCPYTLGVEISVEASNKHYKEGHFLPIIERNTTIPVSRVDTLTTIQDKQKQLLCNIYQGESRLVENNVYLGCIQVDVPKNKAGDESVDIRFTYNVNGILEVEVKVNSTEKITKIIIENSQSHLTTKEIEECFKRLKKLKIHPLDKAENQLVMSKLERLYEENLGDKRQFISQITSQFEGVLNQQDETLILRKRAELESIIQELEESVFE